MNFISFIKIGKRIFILFSLIIIMIIVSILFTYTNLEDIKSYNNVVYHERFIAIDKLIEADRDAYQSNLAILLLVNPRINTDNKKMTKYLDEVSTNLKQLKERFNAFDESFKVEDDKINKEKKIFYENMYAVEILTNQIISLSKNGNIKEAEELYFNKYLNKFNEMRESINTFEDELLNKTLNEHETVEKHADEITLFSLIMLMALLLFLTLFGLLLRWSIVSPLKKIVKGANMLAEGDLSYKINIKAKDELGDVAKAFNVMVDSLSYKASMIEKIANGDLDVDYSSIESDLEKKGVTIRTDNRNRTEEVNSTSDKDVLGKSIVTLINTLKGVLSETQKMTDLQKTGDFEYFIPTEQFKGTYKQVLDGINETVNLHISNILMFLDIIRDYAKGDFSRVLNKLPGKQIVANEIFESIRNNLIMVVEEMDGFIKASVDESYNYRSDSYKYMGDFKKIINGMNQTFETVIEKLHWYEALLDAIPLPISVTDLDMNWTFINKPVEQFLGVNRSEMMGKQCNGWNANICNTDQCGVARLRNGNLQTLFEQKGMNFQVDSSFILNSKGEKVGHIEIVQDITSKVKVNKYSISEVERLEANLSRLANGNLNFDLEVGEADTYTIETQGIFIRINESLSQVRDSLNLFTTEMLSMYDAQKAGNIDVFIPEDYFSGVYKNMVTGVNDGLKMHINNMYKYLDVVSAYSEGDFSKELETMPGKLIVTTEKFNNLRNNLVYLSDEIQNLVQAAIDGNLTYRADISRFNGDYREMIDGINKTLDAVIRPITDAQNILERMSEKDLSQEMEGDYKGDYSILKTAINKTIVSINEILLQVNEAVMQVSNSSIQVSQASQSLSQGASEQAASLEEITASVVEINSQAKQNTENAMQVNALAKKAKDNSEHGNIQMKELVVAMTDINKSSDEIKKIVKTIDDIAFQINLLALNANVEAARAGKYGKGFAVVADEVRNLAVRSAGAVRETTKMVEDSIGNIINGNRLVDVTAKQLEEIYNAASKVADLAEEVSIGSKEQSIGLDQISKGLNQIDQVTQGNTASAEQSAGASEALARQSEQVKNMLSKFILKNIQKPNTNMNDISDELIMRIKDEVLRSRSKSDINYASENFIPNMKINPKNKKKMNMSSINSLDDNDFGKF